MNQALQDSAFIFNAMIGIVKKEGGMQQRLHTEGPLAEKDQQGLAAERQRHLAAEALAKWRRLKEKVKESFKN